MKEIPVTKFNDSNQVIGKLILTEEGYELAKAFPQVHTFGISFIGEPQEDGTYTNVELVDISLITRENK